MVVCVFPRASGLCLSATLWLINYSCLQEPRHLQLLADLEESNIFTVITGKKYHGAPTDYGFCIKVSRRSKCWDEADSSWNIVSRVVIDILSSSESHKKATGLYLINESL